MKNFEVYEDKIKEYDYDFATKNGEVIKCYGTCKSCDFGINNSGNCKYNQIKWLYEEYKEPIKLSQLEFELLKYFSKKYDYICKEEIVYFENKSNKEWVNLEDWGEDLFAWLNKGEFPIQNILDNCEVVEDEKTK